MSAYQRRIDRTRPKYYRTLVTPAELADLLKRCQEQVAKECDSLSSKGRRCQLDRGHAGLHLWHLVSGNRVVRWDNQKARKT